MNPAIEPHLGYTFPVGNAFAPNRRPLSRASARNPIERRRQPRLGDRRCGRLVRHHWRGRFLRRLLIAAFLVRALPSSTVALGRFLDQVSRFAIGARMQHDAVPTRELALGITPAAVKDLPAPAPPFEDFA